MVSAFLFGASPILAKLSYMGGSNAVTLTFLRSALALPALYVFLRAKKTPIMITREECAGVLVSGVLGTAATTILLYSSYNYLEVGMATAIHFLYPLMVMGYSVIAYREKTDAKGGGALAAGVTGIFFLVDFQGSQSLTGIVLAGLSAVSYSVYMLGVQQKAMKAMPFVKLAFWLAAANTAAAGIYGFFTRQLRFSMSLNAWGISLVIAFSIGIGAVMLLNFGIIKIGAARSSMLCVAEPIIGVIFGVWILKETMTLQKAIGFLLVMVSVALAARSGSPNARSLSGITEASAACRNPSEEP